jgi:VanZ family protein
MERAGKVANRILAAKSKNGGILGVCPPSAFRDGRRPKPREPPMNARPAPALLAWLFRLLAVATGVYTAVLLFATHHPRPGDLVGDLVHRDKTLHFTAYGLLGLLVASTLVAAGRASWRSLVVAAVLLAAFAAADEVTQPLFGRSTETLDWVFDSVGIAAGFTLVAAARLAAGRRFG